MSCLSLPLVGKKALILGVANERSLAWSIAEHLKAGGADIGLTYMGEALEKRVRPLAQKCGASLVLPCDVTKESDVSEMFQEVRRQWDGLDILIHSVAYAPKAALEGAFSEVSWDDFKTAMEISCFSFLHLAKYCKGMMQNRSGRLITLSYHGAQKVVPNYHVMGVAKAALESSVRYLAHELGPMQITVNAISAGPVKTLAASGVKGFKEMLHTAATKSPVPELIEAADIGSLAAFLCTSHARHMTGGTYYVDSGANIMGTA